MELPGNMLKLFKKHVCVTSPKFPCDLLIAECKQKANNMNSIFVLNAHILILVKCHGRSPKGSAKRFQNAGFRKASQRSTARPCSAWKTKRRTEEWDRLLERSRTDERKTKARETRSWVLPTHWSEMLTNLLRGAILHRALSCKCCQTNAWVPNPSER